MNHVLKNWRNKRRLRVQKGAIIIDVSVKSYFEREEIEAIRDVFNYLKVCSPCAPITSGGNRPDLKFALITYLLRQVALVVKNLPASAGDMRDLSSISGSERSPGKVYSNPLQYSCLGNPMDKGDSWTTVHRVAHSWTRLKWLSMHGH